eukprot:scaffold2489_cov196-Skeletonema_dohrnii-CCMP3373.AAC.1
MLKNRRWRLNDRAESFCSVLGSAKRMKACQRKSKRQHIIITPSNEVVKCRCLRLGLQYEVNLIWQRDDPTSQLKLKRQRNGVNRTVRRGPRPRPQTKRSGHRSDSRNCPSRTVPAPHREKTILMLVNGEEEDVDETETIPVRMIVKTILTCSPRP